MKYAEEICALLDEKKDAFERYREETEELLSCPVDDMEGHMAMRAQLEGRINDIDADISHVCGEAGEAGKQMMAAVKNSCSRGEISGELAAVFDKAQEIFTVISTVMDTEPQIRQRIDLEKEILLKKIKENNTGVKAQAAKYFKTAYAPQKDSGYLRPDYGKA